MHCQNFSAEITDLEHLNLRYTTEKLTDKDMIGSIMVFHVMKWCGSALNDSEIPGEKLDAIHKF